MVVFADFLRIPYVLNGPQPLPQRMGGAAIGWPSTSFLLSAPTMQREPDGSWRVVAIMGFPVLGDDSTDIERGELSCKTDEPVPVAAVLVGHEQDRRVWTLRFPPNALRDGSILFFEWPYHCSPGHSGRRFHFSSGQLTSFGDGQFVTELTPTPERPCVLFEIGNSEGRSVSLVAKLVQKSPPVFSSIRSMRNGSAPFPMPGCSLTTRTRIRSRRVLLTQRIMAFCPWLAVVRDRSGGVLPANQQDRLRRSSRVRRPREDYFIDDRDVVSSILATCRERASPARARNSGIRDPEQNPCFDGVGVGLLEANMPRSTDCRVAQILYLNRCRACGPQ